MVNFSARAATEYGSGLSRKGFLRAAGLSLLAAAGPGALTACGGGGGSATSGPFTYVGFLPLETLSFVPEMMALAGGYCEDEGLKNAKMETARGTSQALQSVLGGVAPVTRIATIDLVTARTRQMQPLVNIGMVTREPSTRLNFSLERPIEGPEDLEGKTIGIPSEGGSAENNLLLMLDNAGIGEADVKRQVVAQTPASWEMVRRGRLDGYLSGIDMSLILQKQNDDAGSLSPGDIAPVKSDTQVYVTTESVIKERPDDLRAYLAALTAGMQSILDDDEDHSATLETLRADYSFDTLDDNEIAAEGIAAQAELWTDGGENTDLLHTDSDLWSAGVTELQEMGIVTGVDGNPADWMTNEFLPKKQS